MQGKVNLFNYILTLFYMFLRSRNGFAVRVIQSAKTKSESWTACSQWKKKKSTSYNHYYIYIYFSYSVTYCQRILSATNHY